MRSLRCVRIVTFAVTSVVCLSIAPATNRPVCGAVKSVDFQQGVISGQTAVTWSHQIAPLVYEHCTICHHSNGSAPFSLLTYRDAYRWGPQMAIVTASRYMPPWLPEQGYGDFENERRLSDGEISLIGEWVKDGMLEGDPAAAPPMQEYGDTWQNGTPDLILRVERPFNLPASGSDVFRNFVLPYPLRQRHYIRAMEIRPSVPHIIHHATIIIDRTASFRRAHPLEWRDGVPGMELEVAAGNEFDPDSHFLFWQPERSVVVEPQDMAWELDPGNDLILNMHLKPSGKSEVVSAEIGLYFTNRAPEKKPMLLQLERDDALDLPAGERSFAVEDTLRLPVDVEVLAIYPHAHYLGKKLEAWATLPDLQKKWLIRIPNWNIDQQSVYRYRVPVFLPKGSVVHMHYIYDNSSDNIHNPHIPPIRVKAGNRSVDEMAHLWLQVLPVNTPSNGPDPRLSLEEAWMRRWLSKEPEATIPLYNLASTFADEGRYQDAIAAYQHALVLHPDNEQMLNSFGAALEQSGNWERAEKTYQQAIKGHSDICDARFNLARLELKHDHVPEAAKEFHRMLEECPTDAAIHSGLGVALARQGQTEAAESEFRTALEIDPNDFTALHNLGDLALQANQTQRALELLEAAVKQNPKDADVREQLAHAYALSGLADKAISQMREAILLSPNNPMLHALLAQILADDGQLPAAIVEQKEAVRLQPNDADGWNNLGVLEAKIGNLTEARQDFRHALQLVPDHAQAHANLQNLR